MIRLTNCKTLIDFIMIIYSMIAFWYVVQYLINIFKFGLSSMVLQDSAETERWDQVDDRGAGPLVVLTFPETLFTRAGKGTSIS